MAEDTELKRGLTLPMAIFIIVGLVIGSSIWVSPAAYLSRTGPAIFLAYILAVVPAIFVAYCCAYIGSALPVGGGSYMVSSRLTGKFLGFISVWMIILGVCAALASMAALFSVFIAELFLIPEGSRLLFVLVLSTLILVGFYLLNILHVEISGLVEIIIVLVGDILVMIIFIVAAAPHFNTGNFVPLFPLGITPILFATLIFFYSYTGFTMIIDVAGEVKNPKKNIPRAILVSIILLTILYAIQALMVAGIHPWRDEVGTVTEIILLSGILPPALLIFITILIAVAIASTIHPIFLAYSRDFLMAGRDEFFPRKFAKLHSKFKTPVPGLTLLLIVSLIFLFTFIPLLGPEYGIATTSVLLSAVTAVTVLLLQVPLCIAAMRIPKKYPALHENSGFKPNIKTLKIMAILGAVSSIIFVLFLFADPDAGLIISLIVFPYLGIGVILYLIRKRTLKNRGIDMNEIVKSWPKQITFDEEVPSKVERLAHKKSD
ncbi:MAG: amino acid permease [Promethearchaeota archaeon]|nr:MAG: amino acid permease [Candidatus Lokiarchaeota archaeon]